MSERSKRLHEIAYTPDPEIAKLCGIEGLIDGNVLTEAEAAKARRIARLTSDEEFFPDEFDKDGNI
jgi:hypothetical protein